MFVTVPDFEFPVPAQLRSQAAARYWRALSLQHFSAWHIVTMRVVEGRDEHLSSLVFAWDQDLLEAIEEPGPGALVSLTSMVAIDPHHWTAVPIREVWKGNDPNQDGRPCVVLVDQQERQRSGFLGDIAPELQRERMVARLPQDSGFSKQGAATRRKASRRQ